MQLHQIYRVDGFYDQQYVHHQAYFDFQVGLILGSQV